MNQTHIRAIVSLFALTALTGCFTEDTSGPPFGVEGTIETCYNRIDDDHDGMIDCRDPGCLMESFCDQVVPANETIEPEGRRFRLDIMDNTVPDGTATLTSCNDLIDNDQNGKFDCGDPGCQSVYETCCVIEATNELCRNGIDDDGNGFADCQENSCRRSPFDFVTACDSETWGAPDAAAVQRLCTDGIDNDGNRTTDCADTACSALAFCAEDCHNGIDDNHDGRTDCDDVKCFTDPMCPGHTEHSLAECTDGVDNDGNGYTDCADFNCSRASNGASAEAVMHCASLPTEHSLADCSDGVDNDRNGYTDCEDHACTLASSGASPEAVAYCAMHTEASFDRCTDGIDNDGNGYTDCGDNGCTGLMPEPDPMNPSGVRAPCQESVGNPVAACSDGRDNDRDGFVDCDDWDCNWNPATRAMCRTIRAAGAPVSTFADAGISLAGPGLPLVCATY
jgi:hypothetical protein